MIKILIVDDHQLMRAGLSHILKAEADFQVVAEACDGNEALQLARQHEPDIVLMDVKMPGGMGGIEATRRMVRLLPGVKVIALTALDDDPFPARLNEAGAAGYLTKGCPSTEMMEAIRAVYRGQPYIEAEVARKHMLDEWQRREPNPFEVLSAREAQVAMMILEGQRTQEMSEGLSLSPKTVSTYRQRIYDKLGISTDVELTRLAYRHGLIDDQS